MNPDWRDDAACRGQDPNIWLPERGESVLRAKRICSTCPVADDCLEYALRESITVGIYGGLSEKQRRPLRQKRRRERLCVCGAPPRVHGAARCEDCEREHRNEQKRRHAVAS